jgi:endonuclease-3
MKKYSSNILSDRRKKVVAVTKILKKLDPHPQIALQWKTPWQLVVAVQLSAQCTDKKVNEVTPALFRKYKKLEDYIHANPAEFDHDVRQITFHRNKTRNIIGAAKKLKADFNGKVPKTIAELTTLPGMGRKSANVVLSSVYGIGEGIAVDTHVWRLARMLGFTDENTPDKIEQDLLHIVPKKDWPIFNYLLVDYGRAYCPARKHDHTLKKCPLARFYVRDAK